MNMFLGLMLICDPNAVESCNIVRGPFFETYEECLFNLGTDGLAYVLQAYGADVHVAYLDCIVAELQGEPA